jgi:hypothetical protein
MAAIPTRRGARAEESLKKMRRLFAAVREWLQLRARVREERRFHLDSAAADLRALGLSSRAAKREARSRLGSRRNLKLALREVGGDMAGLIFLLRSYRVTASLWLQPATLLALSVLMLALSPSPREIVNGVIGQSPSVDLGVEFVSADGPFPWGITPDEFEALRSMTTVTNLEPYRGLYARGQRSRGATLEEIQAEARARTGHLRFWAVPLSGRTELELSPAWTAWVIIALYGVFFLLTHIRRTLSGRWLFYGSALFCLHALASLTAWAFAMQLWNRIKWPDAATLAFPMLILASWGAAALQCRYCWTDLRRRCPFCLNRLILPLTDGTADRVLLDPAVTESVCAHGHGALVESRWIRRFGPSTPLDHGIIIG